MCLIAPMKPRLGVCLIAPMKPCLVVCVTARWLQSRTRQDLALAEREAKGPLPREATINTSYGEIRLKLFPDECPKTVENFATHAANGFYDGVIFHRVIKGFMVQTGCPLGDGTGGTSIWGHEVRARIACHLMASAWARLARHRERHRERLGARLTPLLRLCYAPFTPLL